MIDPALTPLKSAVGGLLERDVQGVPDGLLLVATEELLTERARLDAVITEHLQVLNSRQVTVAHCARTTRAWLIEEQHLSEADAARYLTVARHLPFHQGMGEALRDGRINLDHARTILICLRKIDPDLRDTVEKELLTLAEDYSPSDLAALARELADRLGGNENAEAAAQRRHEARHLTIAATIDGMHSVAGMLDPYSAAIVKAALAPLLARLGPEDTRSRAQRTADGLVTIAELAMNSGDLPETGGEKPQVIATMDANDLLARIDAIIGKRATVNGLPVTARTARMIACDAGIIPAVLSGTGEVLDLGRRTPTWSPAQRRALRLEDGGCGWPSLTGNGTGCREPLHRCRIHHIDFYSHGGHTKTKRGIHLCPFHHYLIHHSDWNINKNQHGKITVWRT